MPSWQGRSKGQPLGYKIFIAVLKIGGLRPAYLLLRFVTLYYLLFSAKSTSAIYSYFRKRHGYGVLKSVVKVYQNYNYLGQAIVDKVTVMAGIPNKLTFEFDGINNLHQIGAMQKGGMLLSAHIGNFEAATHLLKDIDAVINLVTFDGENEAIKETLENVTGKMGVKVIVIKDDFSHIFAISEAFSNNELVCMPADRFMEGNKTQTLNFLGADAKFPVGPFALAAKFKVPVSFVLAAKESTFHYHFFASEVKEYVSLPDQTAEQQIIADYVAYMEEKVKRYPEQWYNYYNFWQ